MVVVAHGGRDNGGVGRRGCDGGGCCRRGYSGLVVGGGDGIAET